MPSFFLCGALLLAGSVAALPVAAPALPAPRCTYPGVRPDTRALLRRIDQEVPRAVALTRAELQSRGEADYLRNIWLDSCFSQLPLERAYHQNPFFARKYTDALRRQLTHFYGKPLEPPYDYPHSFNLQVLEYATDEAATAAKHLQDSLVTRLEARCRNRDHKLEPCVYIDSYRVGRRRNCLVRTNSYSQDPMQQSAMHWILSNLQY